MAAYSITARNGFTYVHVTGAKGDFALGLPTPYARQRAGLDIWSNWAMGLAMEGCIPLDMAESLLDLLEARAEARLPAPIRWIRGRRKKLRLSGA